MGIRVQALNPVQMPGELGKSRPPIRALKPIGTLPLGEPKSKPKALRPVLPIWAKGDLWGTRNSGLKAFPDFWAIGSAMGNIFPDYPGQKPIWGGFPSIWGL
ncbi:hypothetical protein CK934_22775 [Chitinophaga sp. MD30]|nr:hypothetical protein CK934_22775 [Chitinophaga sp. MD30]